MRQSALVSSFGVRRGIRIGASGVLLPLVGSAGSVVAWTQWRPPLAVPGRAELTRVVGALGPLGTGLAAAHGLGTTHGTIGLASALACGAGIAGLLLPGRLRLAAAAVIALASVAIAANGLSAFLSASHLHQAWTSAIHVVASHGSSSTLGSVSGAIDKSALAPSGGATASGALGFVGGLNALRRASRSVRLASRATSALPRMP